MRTIEKIYDRKDEKTKGKKDSTQNPNTDGMYVQHVSR
jgi:hypothetical protein